ncbi:MAG TPA: glycosyltransferase [Candidatus Eremiobacteraceae bacterium]|nr:glycosyltransferase [Candidatus Eremiobacteraceae bacterium]
MSSTIRTQPIKRSDSAPKFSIVVPARDEERWIGACLEAIRRAAAPYPGLVETIVVLNRCSDRTAEIALAHGARTIEAAGKNLAVIRNAGARAATGDILITVDADSVMSPRTLSEAERHLASGRYIGGGTMIQPERMSLGIAATGVIIAYLILRYRVSAGLFWLERSTFEALGGFDESLVSVEDVDLAIRLKAFGLARGKRFGTLWKAPITTSCRKFDHFGDWYLLKNLKLARDLLGGRDERAANLFFYDFPR